MDGTSLPVWWSRGWMVHGARRPVPGRRGGHRTTECSVDGAGRQPWEGTGRPDAISWAPEDARPSAQVPRLVCLTRKPQGGLRVPTIRRELEGLPFSPRAGTSWLYVGCLWCACQGGRLRSTGQQERAWCLREGSWSSRVLAR